jgi:hypothetical protein
MTTRRSILALPALATASPNPAVRPLEWSSLPPSAQRIAPDLGLTPERWTAWQSAQRALTQRRIQEGTAEHLTYYVLQSRAFTDAPPLEPMRLAHENPSDWTAAAKMRAAAFEQSEPNCERHRALRAIWDAREWPAERCYRHTMAFLRAKEIDSAPLDNLYESRGFSSDTQPWSSDLVDGIGGGKRILLAGPGLDFTRREKFDDNLPLRSYQLDQLRRQHPDAVIDCADVRPEVILVTGATRTDVTVEYAAGSYDLVVATNLLLYFPLRELFTALAGFRAALAPGGRLVHNEQRFAAKVFGEALGLRLERFEPMRFAARKGIEQWDRIVAHRKGEAQ